MMFWKTKLRIVKVLTRRTVALLLSAGILLIGCAHGPKTRLPVCPPPSVLAVQDLELMRVAGDFEKYPAFMLWVSEMERYCSALRSF
jgi:hypothetical protein